MQTAPLKTFATSARTELIREVDARLTRVLAAGSSERIERSVAIGRLEEAIAHAGPAPDGRRQVVEEVAYTWFNRLIAMRFMDANGYTGIGVVSPATGQIGQPEVLSAAKRGQLDGDVVRARDAQAIAGLLNGTRAAKLGSDAHTEAYELLLSSYCRHWHTALPFMFQPEADYTELLMPSNLLAEDSVLGKMAGVLTAEACQDVEVIGWLYQFYISDRKAEVSTGFEKNKKAGAAEIPAATQLFTPHWIVRYLVENSVGRLWLLNNPESSLVDQMDYYIAPVEEEVDFLRITSPEELTVIDPACGSGHMLTYAFDLLYAIYEEEGYAPSEIPSLILTHNLFGTEIDRRAGALASFALSMKAAARRKSFLKKPVAPNVCVIEPASFTQEELAFLAGEKSVRAAETVFWNQFEDADSLGALIQPGPKETAGLAAHLGRLEHSGDMLHADALERARRVAEQAGYLSRKYSVAVANPPYMGSKQMNAQLAGFLKDKFPHSKSDLFAAFIERCAGLTLDGGTVAMITMQSWMFLSSYEKLRGSLLQGYRISSMLHLGARAFDTIGGEVVSTTAFTLSRHSMEAARSANNRPGSFIRLVDGTSEAQKGDAFQSARKARTVETGFYQASAADFKIIPGVPIVYWLSDDLRKTFAEGTPLGQVSTPLVGLRTGDNARFMRQWWEVSADRVALGCDSLKGASETGAKWFPYNKGGDFRRWYGNHEYVVNWENDGDEIERGLAIRYPYLVPAGKDRVRGQGRDWYFSTSISWSDISAGSPSFRYFPKGFIHGNKGNSLFDTGRHAHALAGILNSSIASSILAVLAPTMTASVGDVAKTPVPKELDEYPTELAKQLIDAAREDWNSRETAWDFLADPLVSMAMRSASEENDSTSARHSK